MTARYVTWGGERVKFAELCRRFGVDKRTVASRLERGMSLKEALTKERRTYPSGVRRSDPPEPPEPPAPAPTSWHKAIEEATNVQLARGPITDEAAEVISELLSLLNEGAMTPTRQRLLARGRAWLLRVGWQR